MVDVVAVATKTEAKMNRL